MKKLYCTILIASFTLASCGMQEAFLSSEDQMNKISERVYDKLDLSPYQKIQLSEINKSYIDKYENVKSLQSPAEMELLDKEWKKELSQVLVNYNDSEIKMISRLSKR